jgi:hypothetical protein
MWAKIRTLQMRAIEIENAALATSQSQEDDSVIKFYSDGDIFPKAKKEHTGFVRLHFFYNEEHNRLMNAIMQYGQQCIDSDGRVFYTLRKKYLPTKDQQ